MQTIKQKALTLALVLLLPLSSWGLSYPSQFDEIFKAYSGHYLPGIDWRLLKAQCYQESLLNPVAVSPVGAKGLCQFMPATWRDMQRQLDIKAGPFNAVANARAAAYYMRQLRRGWSSPRPERDRHSLAMASYNAGFGNLLSSQRACGGAPGYLDIIACLPDITGHHSQETITYVKRIWHWHEDMIHGHTDSP